MKDKNLQNWKTLEKKITYEAPPWISHSIHKVLLPDGRVIDDFNQVGIPDFVVIVATTPEGLYILERQYKHGIGKVSLTLPGGSINPGESPLCAAKRELLEETGLIAGSWEQLGTYVGDANYGCGCAHVFRAHNVVQVSQPDSGDLEEIEIVHLNGREVLKNLLRGEIVATAAVAALGVALLAKK
jgi:ADP-ribose pyrophosphatase